MEPWRPASALYRLRSCGNRTTSRILRPASQDHHEAVDTHAETAGGRHPVLDGRQKLLIQAVGVLVLEPAAEQFLLFHALPLVEEGRSTR